MDSLTETLAIPGNSAVYQRFQRMLKNGEATAFVGAGASAPIYPLWGELIGAMVQLAAGQGAAAADQAQWLKDKDSKPLLVAEQIRRFVNDPRYHEFLFETFKDRTGNDGKPYSPIQGALMQRKFRAYVTTNYDPGLLEARRLLRPEIRGTGFTMWNQNEKFYRWLDTEAPVFFAHGHYDSPSGIVLDQKSYRRAYQNPPYRRLFENLWLNDNLVFVGFSFRDPALLWIIREVVARIVRPSGGAPRHIAIMGVPEDRAVTHKMRLEFEEAYHADALFFHVSGEDYSQLGTILESLEGVVSRAPSLGLKISGEPPRSLFVHETTEDEGFTGREDVIARLDGWARDTAVRLISLTGVGGLGKTAVIAKWLRSEGLRASRPIGGIFFWSFYHERAFRAFFNALSEFGYARTKNLIIALDGLEVIQESPGTEAYGKLLDTELADFLHDHCRLRDGNLMLLTSRFPFPDLMAYLGGPRRTLALPSLALAEGAALLAGLDVGGSSEDRESVSKELEGHPLALRIYAASMPDDARGDPTHLWWTWPRSTGSSLDDKMRRLLTFYENRLPRDQRHALSLISLFRTPVAEATLAILWKTDTPITETLKQLQRDRLVTADPDYTCHPILRDYFRARIVRDLDASRETASLILGRPGAPEARSIGEARMIGTAIELLAEAGDLSAADDLFVSRLSNGSLFRWLPAPQAGLEIVSAFVKDNTRRREVALRLTQRRLGYYLNHAGVLAHLAGEPNRAVLFYEDRIRLHSEGRGDVNLSINLKNLGTTEVSLGLLSRAMDHFGDALELATKLGARSVERDCLAWVGHVASLRGDLLSPTAAFGQAIAIQVTLQGDDSDLYSGPGIRLAEHLIRIGNLADARDLTEVNRTRCDSFGWHQDVARCDWILGWLDTLQGHWRQAHRRLDSAKTTFDLGHMINELSQTLLVKSLCYLGEANIDDAAIACERALQFVASRDYRLIHADALNLRAKIEGQIGEAARARDDAEAALEIAEFCGYAWARREACEILAAAWAALPGGRNNAEHFQHLANTWRSNLSTPAD
jgi:tetratricopeptide (TPR) repeat protein